MTARTAAGSLMIFGGIVIVALSLGAAGYAITNPSWLDHQLALADPDVRDQLRSVLTPSVVTQLAVACAIGGAIEGGASIALGWFVHRGRRWAIGTSIAVTFLRLTIVALCGAVLLLAIATGAAASLDGLTIASVLLAAGVLLATIVLLSLSRGTVPPAMPLMRSSQ